MKTSRVFMLTRDECAEMKGTFCPISRKAPNGYGTCELLIEDSPVSQKTIAPVLDSSFLPPLPPS